MEDNDKSIQDDMTKTNMDFDADEELKDELNDLRHLEDTREFLLTENKIYKSQIEALAKALKGIDDAILVSNEQIAAYEEQWKRFQKNTERLKIEKEELIAEISRIHSQIKAAKEDEHSTGILIDSLNNEFDEIRVEKAIISKRLESVRAGIGRISQDIETRLPHLKEYDEKCRLARTVLRDAQNRMEISLKLRQKWKS